MKKTKIVIACCDDWEGIYVDGQLQYENHRIHAEDIARILDLDITYKTVSEKWMGDRGCLPKELKQVKFSRN